MRENPLRAEIALLSEAYTGSAPFATTLLQTSFRSTDDAGRERLFVALLMDWLALKARIGSSSSELDEMHSRIGATIGRP